MLALLAFTGFLRGGRLWWVVLAGVLCGSAVMVKQSGIDAAVALALWLAWTRRWRALAVLIAAAALPVVAGVLAASSPQAWWDAVVAYRGQGDSLVTGSFASRLDQFWETLPALGIALGPLAVLAVLGYRRAPLLFRLWLAGALLGVLGGGNFHAHYYVQLGAPLAVLGAYGATRLGRIGPTAVGAVVLVALASGAVLSLAPRSTQTRLVWPHDPHLRYDDAAANLIRASVPEGKPIAVTWGDASLYFLRIAGPRCARSGTATPRRSPAPPSGTSRPCGGAFRSSSRSTRRCAPTRSSARRCAATASCASSARCTSTAGRVMSVTDTAAKGPSRARGIGSSRAASSSPGRPEAACS